MKFYNYWAQGEATVQADGRARRARPWKLRAYGGSNEGLEDAQRRAKETAERAAAAIERGRSPDVYGYADRPLREEIIEEIRDANGLAAVITRNSYGALVLNTNRAMFVDVDYDQAENPLTGSGGPSLSEILRDAWDRWRGKPSSVKLARDERLLSRFDDVVRSQPGMGARVYRTAAGFRLLITSDEFGPLATETQRLLEAFGSDPLYIRLCKAQECFRARLSAKFWRCRAAQPPSWRFPWADADEEATYRQWEQAYHQQANQFATCELVGAIGEPAVDEAVRPIFETHDRLTIHDGAPLA